MVETRRLKQLRSTAADLLRLPEGELVLALSGGADSAALAYLLADSGRGFRVVHVNHRLPASGRLEAAARAVAELLGLELETVEIDVPPGASFEGQARSVRYRALFERLRPGETLLTAHTLDDQAETVLMNLLRGTGPAGLAAIADAPGELSRPLLRVSRSETRELASLAGLPYFDDPTNLDRGFRRNLIRLEVIPRLASTFNPRLVQALARTAELIGADEKHLAGEAGEVPLIERGPSIAIPIGALLAVPRPVADRALRRALARIRPPHGGSSAELDRIWPVVERSRGSARIAGGVQVGATGPLLVFSSDDAAGSEPERVVLDVGSYDIGRFRIMVESTDQVCRVAPLGVWSAIFPPDVALEARVDDRGRLVVDADSTAAWVPGERRLPVAWYQAGSNGYLSVFAREELDWTSMP